MSDSDDTDVLLLIPPDLFMVPSSDSEEDSHLGVEGKYRSTGVVSEILEHVQCLESRVSAIESRGDSLEISLLNASLDSYSQTISHPLAQFSPSKQSQPPRTFSRLSSLPNTPVKPLHCSSVKSSPGCLPSSVITNSAKKKEEIFTWRSKSSDVTNHTNPYSRILQKQEDLINFGDQRTQVAQPLENSVYSTSQNENTKCLDIDCKSILQKEDRDVADMELCEVDELLHEMEATELELAKRIDNSNARRCSEERRSLKKIGEYSACSNTNCRDGKLVAKSPMRRLEFQFADEEFQRPFASLNFPREREIRVHADTSLPTDDVSRIEDNTVRISDFKIWDQNVERKGREMNYENCKDSDRTRKLFSEKKNVFVDVKNMEEKGIDRRMENNTLYKIGSSRSSETFNGDTQNSGADLKQPSIARIESSTTSHHPINDNGKSRGDDTNDTVDSALQGTRQCQQTDELQQTIREIRMIGNSGRNSPLAKSTETCQRRTQRLLALSDFWDCDSTKSPEEMLRIRLEEEKFRREHCEHLIQELQKRLLEQQEKVAVAIRVDNEKNTAISQFQSAWSKLRQRWDALEKEHSELKANLINVTEKHQSEIMEYQQQIKRGDGELSKALDLAAGYKEKSDCLVKEKIELLKSHADELEKYKSLVQEAEQRYENVREDCNKLLERNRQLEEVSNNVHQELNKERLRSAEVRTEMGVIHKALDSCEAELTILRQEKESLQLKIKEEITRNGILEQNKAALLDAANEAKNAEKVAKEETNLLVTRQEQIRSELREIYQKQLDDVVKTKLKEFQEQLDAAELAFQADLETRQRAIAECAARKIKNIIDKHQLEINLLEEKHIEEKRLGEIQLAQASQKAVMLEVQLNSQRAGKTQLAEQLHSVMQKQWQQALQIISGGQMDNLSPLQRLNAEKIFDTKNSRRCHSVCCNKDHKLSRPELRSLSSQNLQNSNSRQEQDESLITLTSNDEAPTTRKESKDDLRKYIKMILDMQQPNKDDFVRTNYLEESNSSTPPVTREVPRKHYTKRESNGLSEESVTWQRGDEQSIHDTSEYIPIPQPQGSKNDQHKIKPPWK